MSSFSCQSYVFDPRPDLSFLITAKRYWQRSSPSLQDPTALTLVFAHGNGFHKEQWEPTIEELYNLPDIVIGKKKIREAWTIDAPNHGDAAILNEIALEAHKSVFRWEEYARCIHAFLSGLGTGVDVDFSTRHIIGIGHSMGGTAFIHSTTYYPRVQYSSVILVEPMLFTMRTLKSPNPLEAGAVKRRDIWPDKKEAYTSLKSRPTFRAWDDRVLRIYVEHGMRPLPTIDYPDRSNGVTLKCSKFQEAATFRDWVGPTRNYQLLSHVLKGRQVHIIYGTIDDALPDIKSDVLYKASGGISNFASVSWIEGAGHLMVQTSPRAVAEKICDALSSGATAKSRAML